MGSRRQNKTKRRGHCAALWPAGRGRREECGAGQAQGSGVVGSEHSCCRRGRGDVCVCVCVCVCDQVCVGVWSNACRFMTPETLSEVHTTRQTCVCIYIYIYMWVCVCGWVGVGVLHVCV